jgi:hypothetical protein
VNRKITCFALLVACGGASAADDVRLGLHFAGHLLFTDMIEAGVQWRTLHRPDRAFLRELDLQSGLALSLDGKFVEAPILARFELYHRWRLGFEVAPGIVLSHYEGASALTPVLCASVPYTDDRLRVQPEICFNASAGPPGGPSYQGGLWTNLGIGIFHAF